MIRLHSCAPSLRVALGRAIEHKVAVRPCRPHQPMLDLSKIEGEKFEFCPQLVQLGPLIDEVIGAVCRLAQQNKDRLVVEAPEARHADRGPMRPAVDPVAMPTSFTKEGERRMPALNKYVRCERRPAVLSGRTSHHKFQHFAPSSAPSSVMNLRRFNR